LAALFIWFNKKQMCMEAYFAFRSIVFRWNIIFMYMDTQYHYVVAAGDF